MCFISSYDTNGWVLNMIFHGFPNAVPPLKKQIKICDHEGMSEQYISYRNTSLSILNQQSWSDDIMYAPKAAVTSMNIEENCCNVLKRYSNCKLKLRIYVNFC